MIFNYAYSINEGFSANRLLKCVVIYYLFLYVQGQGPCFLFIPDARSPSSRPQELFYF